MIYAYMSKHERLIGKETQTVLILMLSAFVKVVNAGNCAQQNVKEMNMWLLS